jgi:hypothetical protein
MTQCPMTIKAVVFDIGDVLERVGDETWLQEWRPPDMSAADLDQALAGVDPDSLIPIGGMSEQEYLRRYADALRLDADRFDAFAAAVPVPHRGVAAPEVSNRDPQQLLRRGTPRGAGEVGVRGSGRLGRLLARGRPGEAGPADLPPHV